MIEKYKQYVEQFNQSDSRIVYKWEHSLRVMEKMQALSKVLKQNQQDYELATIIGLFHDYGRFYQVETFNTYQDQVFDHGDYGAEQLIHKHELQNFISEKVDEQVIYDAIKNHNKFQIDSKIKDKSLLFSKMVRDADKLDILEGIAKGYVALEEDDSDITPEVKNVFFQNQELLSSLRKTKNDRIVSFLCLIYDLNYQWSYQYLDNHNILNQIYERLVHKEMFKPYFEELHNFINKEKEE